MKKKRRPRNNGVKRVGRGGTDGFTICYVRPDFYSIHEPTQGGGFGRILATATSRADADRLRDRYAEEARQRQCGMTPDGHVATKYGDLVRIVRPGTRSGKPALVRFADGREIPMYYNDLDKSRMAQDQWTFYGLSMRRWYGKNR